MTPHPATPRLVRSRNDKVVGGVAGGLGHYLGVDPVILRIAFVVLGFMGPGVLIYIVAWIAMPLGETAPGSASPPSREAVKILVGGLLVAVGVLLVLNQVIPWFDTVLLPAILIAVGMAILVYNMRK